MDPSGNPSNIVITILIFSFKPNTLIWNELNFPMNQKHARSFKKIIQQCLTLLDMQATHPFFVCVYMKIMVSVSGRNLRWLWLNRCEAALLRQICWSGPWDLVRFLRGATASAFNKAAIQTSCPWTLRSLQAKQRLCPITVWPEPPSR